MNGRRFDWQSGSSRSHATLELVAGGAMTQAAPAIEAPVSEIIDIDKHHRDDQQAQEGGGDKATYDDNRHGRAKAGIGAQPQRDG